MPWPKTVSAGSGMCQCRSALEPFGIPCCVTVHGPLQSGICACNATRAAKSCLLGGMTQGLSSWFCCGTGSTETLAFAAAMVFDLQVGHLLKQPAGWNGVVSTLLAFSVGAAVLVAVFMQQEKQLEDKMLAS